MEHAPNDPAVHFEFALLLYRLNKLDDAYTQAKIAVGMERIPRNFSLFGRISLDEKRYLESLDIYRDAVETFPNDVKLRNEQHKVGMAVEMAYTDILQKNLGDGYNHALLGNAYFAEGRLTDAETEMREAVKATPTNAMYQADLAMVLIQNKKYADALNPMIQATKLEPTNVDYTIRLGYLLGDLNKPDEALAAFQTGLDILSSSVNGTSNVIKYDNNTIYNDMIALCKDQVQNSPTDATAHFRLGLTLLKSSDLWSKLHSVTMISMYHMDSKKDNHPLLIEVADTGIMVPMKSDNSNALEGADELRQASELSKTNADYWYYYAKTLNRIGDWGPLADALDHAIELDPDNALYHASKAHYWLIVGDINQAFTEIGQAHELDPNNMQYLCVFAQLNYRITQYLDAEKDLRQASDKSVKNSECMAALAAFLGAGKNKKDRLTKNYLEAADLWRAALAINPQNPCYHAGLALALNELGMKDNVDTEINASVGTGVKDILRKHKISILFGIPAE